MTTDDLVSRLRAKASKGGVIPIHDMTIEEAADRIEHLQSSIEEFLSRFRREGNWTGPIEFLEQALAKEAT